MNPTPSPKSYAGYIGLVAIVAIVGYIVIWIILPAVLAPF